MKKSLLLIALSVLVLMASAGAATITVYNTGVDNSNVVLAPGTPDPHYTLTGGTAFAGSTPPAVWIANSSTSEWITPGANASTPQAPGTYIYTQTFTLGSFGSATLSGQWTSDNDAVMRLNGNLVSSTPATGYAAFTPFTTSSGFVVGTNTLTFTVTNTPGSNTPTGLRVEISGTTTALPEPASLACVGAGLLALGGIARRRRAARQ